MKQSRETTVYSEVPEANALYLQAREALSKGDPWEGGSLENARKAITLLEQAVQKDPEFALAYLETARAWSTFGYSVSEGISSQDRIPKAKAAVLKAARAGQSLDDMRKKIKLPKYRDWGQYEAWLPLNIEGMYKRISLHRRGN